MAITDKRKKKKEGGRKEPTQQTKINLIAIAPPVTTRNPYDNLISFNGTQVEELAVLKRLLLNNGSHPYKESLYDLGSNIQPQTMGIWINTTRSSPISTTKNLVMRKRM